MFPREPEEHTAEFDRYAADYDAGMDNPLKRLAGSDAESFIEVKVDWLLRRPFLRRLFDDRYSSVRLLDYGCGAGTMLSTLRRRGFAGSLAGCDVSPEMLAEAQRRWRLGPPPNLRLIESVGAPFADCDFDVVILSSVLHHIDLAVRPRVYADVMRLVKPGGLICIFEHNPYNPITRWVVSHTPIDTNAVLLKSSEVCAELRLAGVVRPRTSYIMFFPPRLTLLRTVEDMLQWLPLGAQYVVCADRV